MGDWFISIILSICSVPFILKFLSSLFSELFKKLFNLMYKVSITSDDFPLPDTPVTHIKLPKWKDTDKFFKLLVLTFDKCNSLFLLYFRLFFGKGIFFVAPN